MKLRHRYARDRCYRILKATGGKLTCQQISELWGEFAKVPNARHHPNLPPTTAKLGQMLRLDLRFRSEIPHGEWIHRYWVIT